MTTPAGINPHRGKSAIGRAPTCDVIIADPLVSREHAHRIGQEVFIEDLQSANGVYVNNVRIFEPHQLCDGDRILVGTGLCVFAVTSRRQPTAFGWESCCSERSGSSLPPAARYGAVLIRAAEHRLSMVSSGS
jgi:predicted component of type VI protein secretion system